MPGWCLVTVCSAAVAAGAFTASGAEERYVGTIDKLETSPAAISIRLDGGGLKWVAVPPDATVLRVVAGEKSLSAAAQLKFDEMRIGDRVLVRAEGEPPMASQILVLSSSDLVRKQDAERDDWKKRGVAGRVLSVAAQQGEVTIAPTPGTGAPSLRIRIAASTEQRRYRPDSARFSDALPSAVSDIREGDRLQALGDRTPDGRIVIAIKVVSGTFRNFTATVGEVNGASQQMVVRPAAGQADLTVKIAPGAILRRLNAQTAAQLTRQKSAQTSVPGEPSPLDGASLTIADFRPGDAVVIATLNGSTEAAGAKLTAVAVIAGVEQLLKRSAGEQKEILGSWNLSLDPESAGGGQR